MLQQNYRIPSNSIRRLFVRKFSDELDRVLERKGNMERVLYFTSMILQVSSDIKGAANVWYRLKQKMIEVKKINQDQGES